MNEPAPAPRVRRYAILGAKVLVSVLLLAWVLGRADLSQVGRRMAAADIGLLVLAFSLFFIGYHITALRSRLLLRAQGVDVPVSFLVRSFMVAIFFNNFLPSTIGGDVMRMVDLWRFGASKSHAFTAVVIDRFFGLSALLIFALVALALSAQISARVPGLQWWVVSLGLVGLTVIYLLFHSPDWLWSLLGRMRVPLPRKLIKLLKQLIDAVLAFRGRGDVLWSALALSVLLQTNVVVHYYLIALALDLQVPWTAFFLVVPVAVIVMMIPVSINAIGVRESVFVFMLALYGVAGSDALAFAWIAYGFVLLQGVLGGIIFALRK